MILKAQHNIEINATYLPEKQILDIKQDLIFHNQSNDTLHYILLNDWNHSFSSNKTPLAQRFSDEFIRSFYLSNKSQKGFTRLDSVSDIQKKALKWERPTELIDWVKVYLKTPLYPNQKISLHLKYEIKIPHSKFTGYGYDNNGINLKEWYLFPGLYVKNKGFVAYNNFNLDDASCDKINFNIKIKYPQSYLLHSEANIVNTKIDNEFKISHLTENDKLNFKLILEKQNTYKRYQTEDITVVTNLYDSRLDEIEKAILIDKITGFVNQNLGNHPQKNIIVSQCDYQNNPIYGLNQLPSFITPFSDHFQFEIKFLKTYLYAYLKNSLIINQREDKWIIDGIQMFLLKKYVEENHPKTKLIGELSSLKILKGYYFSKVNFNEQYYIAYLFMARKNLDQPIGLSKDKFIRFNDKISGKYKAGLALNYFNEYYGSDILKNSLSTFYDLGKQQYVSRKHFKQILEQNSNSNLDWYFNHFVESQNIVNYQLKKIKSNQKDSITFRIKNLGETAIPFPLYGLSNDSVMVKKWLPKIHNDSTFTWPSKGIDKWVLNHNHEMPEYNMRNNFVRTHSKINNNRPLKFSFFSDIEDPSKKQIFYVPSADYNLYNGLYLGMRFHNKSIIDKRVEVDVNPFYSYKSNSVIGFVSLSYDQIFKSQKLYQVRYYLSASQFDYTADAKYYKFTPALSFSFRDPNNLRNNFRERIMAKYVLVHRENSALASSENLTNYGVFNLKYNNNKSELLYYKGINTDLQLSKNFGKVSVDMGYKHLFKTNQQFYIRFYAGKFLYRNLDNSFFDFALDRPTDYLFEYNYYGRSESTGIYSQQIIIAEGGFKSKLAVPYANQWISTVNLGFNVWNWFDIYGDVGVVKNKFENEKFLYDSGIKISLVPDFFELYFPINSSNGWEISQPNYAEKIRFTFSLSPNTLIRLYTRKWF